MSAPSICIFYKDQIEIRRYFINCGWFCNTDTIKRGVKDTLVNCGDEFDWDIVEAYGMKISKEEII